MKLRLILYGMILGSFVFNWSVGLFLRYQPHKCWIVFIMAILLYIGFQILKELKGDFWYLCEYQESETVFLLPIYSLLGFWGGAQSFDWGGWINSFQLSGSFLGGLLLAGFFVWPLALRIWDSLPEKEI